MDEKSIEGVARAEQKRCEALTTRDYEALRTLVARDLVHTHTRGVTDNFESYFRFIEQDLLFVEVTRGPLAIRINGDIATMSGEMHNLVLAAGRPNAIVTHAQVLQIWEWRDQAWRLTNFQSTNLPEAQA